jgi:hypothetical protein
MYSFNKYGLYNKCIKIIARRIHVMCDSLPNMNGVVLKEDSYIWMLFSLSYNFKVNIKDHFLKNNFYYYKACDSSPPIKYGKL